MSCICECQGDIPLKITVGFYKVVLYTNNIQISRRSRCSRRHQGGSFRETHHADAHRCQLSNWDWFGRPATSTERAVVDGLFAFLIAFRTTTICVAALASVS